MTLPTRATDADDAGHVGLRSLEVAAVAYYGAPNKAS